ncbi:MAG TPA: hypothetical protein VIG68_01100 [Lysobacter sp.]
MLAFLLWLLAMLGGGEPVASDAPQTVTPAGANADQTGSEPPDDPIKRCIKCKVN